MSRKKWIPSAAPQTTLKFEDTTDTRRQAELGSEAETIKTREYFSAQTPKSWDTEVYRLFFGTWCF
jgi:hypothetical protein